VSKPISVKADIVPYSKDYARVIRSWIDSPKTYRNVCRGNDYPPPQNIVETWQRKGVTSYILFSNNKPVAYGELWNRPHELAYEIAHLIVEPTNRFQGYGTKMLQLLYQRGVSHKGVAKVIINLYKENTAILGCYFKAGFQISSTTTYTEGLRLIRLVT